MRKFFLIYITTFIVLTQLAVGNLYGGEPKVVDSSSNSRISTTYAVTDTLLIHFRFDKAEIESNYLDNATSLQRLNDILSISGVSDIISSITLNTVTSPEGSVQYNFRLSKDRAVSISDYITRYFPELQDRLDIVYSGENWDGLKAQVLEDTRVPYRSEVLSIIDSNMNLDTKEWRLTRVGDGVAWKYLQQNILPKLRSGVVATLHFQSRESYIKVMDKLANYKSLLIPILPEVDKPILADYTYQIHKEEYEIKPLFALKTNLLYDLATLVNFEIEFPIGNRLSLAVEGIFPQWIWDNGMENSKRSRIQTDLWTVEGRYWFGNRADKQRLTGLFGGLYGTYGNFDFEQNRTGIQSRNLFSAGIVAGYAHSINNSGSLRLEYSLSVGYASATIKEYTSEYNLDRWGGWRAFRDKTVDFSWFGPTKAKVSLVWMLNSKVRRQYE